MLSAEAVSIMHGQTVSVRDVSLSLVPGELLALAGPNAAGKSTLLEALAGTTTPHTGSVSLDGRTLTQWSCNALARRRAVLPQHDALSFAFRVEEVVELGLMPHAPVAEAAEVVHEALQRAGVAHLIGRRYTDLSGGERRRVQLARVLAQVHCAAPDAPCYLLLDEPTASLDLAHQHAVMAVLRDLVSGGFGVLAVVHDLNLAARYADRLALLQAGRLQGCGRVHDMLDASRLEAVFGVGVRVWHPAGEAPVVIARA